MKKIVTVFLLFAIMTVFVSCGKDDNGDNTTLPPYTGTNATTSQRADESTTADKAVNGYILTTDPNMTVSWGITTAFQPTLPTSLPSSTGVINIPSITDNQNSSPYNPSMSQVSTTERPTEQTTGAQGPTVVDAPDNTTKPVVPEEETTEAVTKQEKVVAFGSKSVSPDYKKIYIDFNANGWDGAIATRSTKVSVKYGSKTENAPCTIKSGEIVIDTSGLELVSGMTVTVTIPEGAVSTSSGSQYSRTATVSFTI